MSIDVNDFIEGLDPSVLAEVSGAQLLQMIRNATPSGSRGLIIYDDDTPDTGTYPNLKRYSWFKPSELNKIQRRWNPNTNTWEAPTVGSLTVDTSQIIDGAVTLAKLYNPAGSPLYLLRVNAAGNGFELWQLAFDPNSIDISKIIKGSANTLPHIKSDGSAWEFITPDQVVQLVNSGVINIGQITAGLAGTIPVQNSAGTTLSALAPGSEGQLLGIVSGLPAWKTVSAQVFSNIYEPAVVALPGGVGISTFNHAFNAVPYVVKVTLVCVTAENGYSVGDEVLISSVSHSNGTGDEYPIPVTVDINNLIVSFSANPIVILPKSGAGILAIFTRAKWNLKVVCIK